MSGKRIGWIKWHRSVVLYGLVLDIVETKVEGVFNLEYGVWPDSKHKIMSKDVVKINDKSCLRVGKTFATTQMPKEKKDSIEIEVETINLIHNLKNDTYKITAWSPRFLRIVPFQKVDSISKICERARKNKVFQEKQIGTDGKIRYLND